MSETNRLQKIRNLGVRLHELDLVAMAPNKSYASTALNFLFAAHKLQRPTGVPLEHTLYTLGQAIIANKKVRFSNLDADAVIDFFCRQYRVH
ncbi:hypothetical protein [Rheinheimera sp. MMS21-TC3]|uniref:hypothetical protein n=1 Tax=Rheinheimera sp. MMS21-TC3 TaxID=3072790 RepID=UPI0028C3A32A|nr:hypothetical protein [Rheinheimera sp. MMS21-TC3]WNO62056.1 hypothetical protein RDV63_14195 [Rheinheimera sp. MMS21-TC3]